MRSHANVKWHFWGRVCCSSAGGASNARIGRKWPGVQCLRQSCVTVVDQLSRLRPPIPRTPLTEKKIFRCRRHATPRHRARASAIRRIHFIRNSRCLFASGIDIITSKRAACMVVRHSTSLAFGSVDDGRGRSAVLSSRKKRNVCWQVSL